MVFGNQVLTQCFIVFFIILCPVLIESNCFLFIARLHVSVHGIHGAIARTNSCNQIVPTTVRLHVGLREKETKQYTISSGWNETFSFDLTYHEHLFWNLQVIYFILKIIIILLILFSLKGRCVSVQIIETILTCWSV